jgi:hypothetical protein
MSQKKRVRVIAPQVNTDHFANYMFEVGGPVGMNPMAPMQQGQDTSQDLNDVIQMYAQAMGLDQQQLEQMYSAIMQMQPEEQSQAIAQMQQELNSSMAANPMVKNGGNIKHTKKLLNKKIGGANTNMTSSSLVEQQKQIFKDAIGANMARDLVNNVTEDNLSAANNLMGYAANMMTDAPTYDYGGYTNTSANQGMGYANVEDNPFYNAMTNIENQVGPAIGRSLSAIGNIGFKPTGKIKVKRSGDLFGKNAAQASTNPPSNEFFRQDFDKNAIPDYLQLDTASMYNDNLRGMSYGGYTPRYQNGATTGSVENINTALNDLNVRDEDYHAAVKAYNLGTHTPEQLNTMNKVDNYVSKYSSKSDKPTTTQTDTETTTKTNTTAGGINGWHGGFYFQNGVPVTSIQDIQNSQQGQTNNFNPAALFQPGNRNMMLQGSLANFASNPAMIQKFGKALTQFQPDNVYLSQAKGRVNPFGAKVVLKWDYDENGRPVQREEVVEDDETATYGNPKTSNLMGRIRSKFDVMKYDRDQRRAGTESFSTSNNMSDLQSMGYNVSPEDVRNEEFANENQMQRQEFDIEQMNRNNRINPYASNVKEFAYGGIPKARAGKMVIKENYAPQWDTVGQAYSPFADGLKSLLQQRDTVGMENQIYNTGSFVPPIPMDQLGSRGMWGTATNTGKEIADLKPLNYSDSTYQNLPGYELSGQTPYQPIGKYGGMYQAGGQKDTQPTAESTPGQFYSYALGEKKYFLDNPETWKEDVEMQNPDGSFNLCLDCLNVDYNDPGTVQDVVKLINEGHSQYPHHSADVLTASLNKFGIPAPIFGSAMQKKYGGSYQVGGTYELSDQELDDIVKNGGEFQYY